jgi:hypothetical protein
MNTRLACVVVAVTWPCLAFGQARPAAAPSDTDIVQAVNAVERADGYADLLAQVQRHAAAISSPRTIELIDARLRDQALDDNQRGLLMLERELSADTRARGADAAARLLSIRLIAGYALLANSPEQLAGVLEKFLPLAKSMTPQEVREALDTPGNGWPAALFPLMEQLARDWPARGSLGVATRMAEAAAAAPQSQSPSPAPAPAPARAATLVGHWRSTSIVFDQPRDEHLVMRPDGTAETWTVTASSTTPVTRGRWRAEGTNLAVDWQDGQKWGQAFTFYQGQLVLPNVADRRKFWDRVE